MESLRSGLAHRRAGRPPARNRAQEECFVPLQTVEPRRLYRQIVAQVAGLAEDAELARKRAARAPVRA